MTEAAQKSASAAKAQQGRSHAESLRPEGPEGAREVGVLQGLAGNRAVSSTLGGGQPLPQDLREEMERRFGTDFGTVRIHDDAQAHASAADLHAKAFTHGSDIVFSANRFAPHAGPGKRLLAHELAHVVQQRRGGAAPVLNANASHERSADAAASAVANGQTGVAVAGATGVGVARDEDESWSAKIRRKYREAKEKIPAEYREKIQEAADFAADKAVDTLAMPLGPAATYATDGLGSAMLHGVQKAAAGEEGATDDLKNFGRDKVQESLGSAKGVATQLTEVIDTAMWAGNEYKELRDKAAAKIGGKEDSVGNTMVKRAMNAAVQILPGMQALPALADASDAAKDAGLVDTETGQASLTAPMSDKLNKWAKAAEEKLGATPRDPEMFTPMEKAEIGTSIGVQVALSATGAEEVKIAMNVIGALSGLRSIVETIRNDEGWKTSPRFWGHIIGLGLSIVGLKHSMAADKLTTLVLKYGGVAAAIPALTQMAVDYYALETHPEMPEDERKKLEASIKQDWVAAIHIVKDAILHVAQSQGGKPKGAPPPEEDPTAGAATGSKQGTGPIEDVTPAAATETPLPAKAVPETPVNPEVPAATAQPDAPTPIGSAKGKPQSPASKALAANLAKQAPEKAGSVTALPARKSGDMLPSEPASQNVVDVAEPVAVGQTRGPGEAVVDTGKPKMSLIPGGNEPTVASQKPPGAAPDASAAPMPKPTTKSTAPAGSVAEGAGRSKTKVPSKPAANGAK